MATTATVTVQVNGEAAKQKITDLTEAASKLKDQITQAYIKGDDRGARQLSNQLRTIMRDLSNMRSAASNVDDVLANLSTSSVKDLSQTLSKMKKTLESGQIARGSKEWDEYTKKLNLVRDELAKVRTEMEAASTVKVTDVTQSLDTASVHDLNAALTQINKKLSDGSVARGSAEWEYYQQKASLVTAELAKIRKEGQKAQYINLDKVFSNIHAASVEDLNAALSQINAKLTDGSVQRGTKEWDDYQRKLAQVKEELKNIKEESAVADKADVSKVLSNIHSASVKDLNSALTQINQKLTDGSVARGTAEWDDYQKKLKEVKKELSTIKDESAEEMGVWDKMNNFVDKYAIGIAGVGAAAAGFYMQYKEWNDYLVKKDSAKANVKALTGLGDEDVEWLAAEAERMSSSTTEDGMKVQADATEILRTYQLLAGAKNELLSDKELLVSTTVEANRLAVASGESLEDSTNALVGALNMYGASASEAAKFTNVLAAGAGAGAAEVNDINAAVLRSGVAAANTNIPIEQLVGAIETLAEKGLKAEKAGTGLKTFFLKLASGADDTNPQVVGLSQALDNLAAKNMNAEETVKMFGLQTYNTAKILIENRKLFNDFTAAVTDTDVAVQQAAINSNTLDASSKQLRNSMNAMKEGLARELRPIMTSILKIINSGIKALPEIISFIKENYRWIVAIAAPLITYNALLKLNVARLSLGQAAHKAYAAVLGLTKNALNAAKTAAIAFGRAVKTATPLGIITTVVAIGSAIWALAGKFGKTNKEAEKLTQAMKDMEECNKEAASSVSGEYAEVDNLYAKLNDVNLSYQERNDALIKLQQIVPSYHAELSQEGKLINENKEALDEYKRSLIGVAMQKSINAKVGQYTDALAEANINYAIAESNVKTALEGHGGERGAWVARNVSGAYGSASFEDVYEVFDDVFETEQALADAKKNLDEAQRNLDEFKSTSDKWIVDFYKQNGVAQADASVDAPSVETDSAGDGGNTPSDAEKQRLQELDDWAKRRKLEEQRYYDEGQLSFEEYTTNLHDIEEDLIKRKMALYNEDSTNYKELLAQNATNDIEYGERIIKSRTERAKRLTQLDVAQGNITSKQANLADKKAELQEQKDLIALYGTNGKVSSSNLAVGVSNPDSEKGRAAEVKAAELQIEISKLELSERTLQIQKKYQKVYLEFLMDSQNIGADYEARKAEIDQAMQDEIDQATVDLGLADAVEDVQKATTEAAIRVFEGVAKQMQEAQKLFEPGGKYGTPLSSEDKARAEADKIDSYNADGYISDNQATQGKQKVYGDALPAIINEVGEGMSPSASYAAQLKKIEELEAQGLISHEQAEKQKEELTRSRFTKAVEDAKWAYDQINQVVSAASQYMQSVTEAETAAVEESYDKQIERAGSGSRKAQRLEKEKEKKLTKIRNESNDKQMKIQIAQSLASTAFAAIQAYGSQAGIPIVGPALGAIAAAVATAAGMLQVATIRKQYQAQKSSYAVGGFTPNGKWDEVQGEVHSGEFIANRFAVQNPNVRPVLNLLDQAQKTNSVGRLTAEDVTASLRTRTSPDVVRAVSVTNTQSHTRESVDSIALNSTAAALARSADVIEKLNAHLDDGITAVATISGKEGIYQKTKDYEKLRKNAQR